MYKKNQNFVFWREPGVEPVGARRILEQTNAVGFCVGEGTVWEAGEGRTS
jgi:hypothetical protein